MPSYGINDFEVLSIREDATGGGTREGFDRVYSISIRVQLRTRTGLSGGSKRVTGTMKHGQSGVWVIIL